MKLSKLNNHESYKISRIDDHTFLVVGKNKVIGIDSRDNWNSFFEFGKLKNPSCASFNSKNNSIFITNTVGQGYCLTSNDKTLYPDKLYKLSFCGGTDEEHSIEFPNKYSFDGTKIYYIDRSGRLTLKHIEDNKDIPVIDKNTGKHFMCDSIIAHKDFYYLFDNGGYEYPEDLEQAVDEETFNTGVLKAGGITNEAIQELIKDVFTDADGIEKNNDSIQKNICVTKAQISGNTLSSMQDKKTLFTGDLFDIRFDLNEDDIIIYALIEECNELKDYLYTFDCDNLEMIPYLKIEDYEKNSRESFKAYASDIEKNVIALGWTKVVRIIDTKSKRVICEVEIDGILDDILFVDHNKLLISTWQGLFLLELDL